MQNIQLESLLIKGDFYPCLRIYKHSLNNHEEWSIGSTKFGIDMEKLRPFMVSQNCIQSDDECLNCSAATGCGFCQGFNYDDAETPTNMKMN